MYAIAVHNIDSVSLEQPEGALSTSKIEMFHEQLPLPVPCYDLLPVTDLTVGHPRMDFGYYQLP